MTTKALIDVLNNLTSGELSRLSVRLADVRAAARDMGLDEVVALLDEATAALDASDLKTFRRKIQHAVSRLGHAPKAVRAGV